MNVYGTDLGSMFLHGDGRVYIVFGDTLGSPGHPDLGFVDWRSNAMACTSDLNAADGLILDGWITDAGGDAIELVLGLKQPNDGLGEVTKIPTCSWSDGTRQFLWYMSIRQWGVGGEPGQWAANRSEIAYFDDDGQTWTSSGVAWPEESNFIQVAVAESEPRTLTDTATYPVPYGAYMHPRFVDGRGETVYFLMSQWRYYNVSVIRMTFSRTPGDPAP